MLELVLIAAANLPRVFANEYCVARWVGGLDHDAAIEKAKTTWGGLEYNDEAQHFIDKHCSFIQETEEDLDA